MNLGSQACQCVFFFATVHVVWTLLSVKEMDFQKISPSGICLHGPVSVLVSQHLVTLSPNFRYVLLVLIMGKNWYTHIKTNL